MPSDDAFSNASGGQLAGTKSLQSSIDALTKSNNQLKSALQQSSSAATGGLVTTPAQSQGAQGQTFTSGSFPRSNGGYLSPQYIANGGAIQQGGYQPGAGYAGFPNSAPAPMSTPGSFPASNGGYAPGSYTYQGGASGPPEQFGNSVAVPTPDQVQPFGGQNGGGSTSSEVATMGGNNGGVSPTGGGGGQGGQGGQGSNWNYINPGGSGSGGSGGSSGGLGSLLGGTGIGGALGSLLGGLATQGGADLSPQVSLNSAYQQAMLGTAPGTSNSYNSIYTQMAGWGNTKPNAVATSAADAGQGFLTLGNMAGTPGNLNVTALGRAAQTAWAGAGVLSPGLGSTGAANVASSIYSSTTSQLMHQLGYRTTPLPAKNSGGAPAGMAQIAQGIFSKWDSTGQMGKLINGAPSSQSLAASLAPGQTGSISLQALGLNPQAMTPVLEGYDKLAQQGVSPTKANSLFEQAANGSSLKQINAAQTQLANYGIPKSDFQSIKNLQSQQTGRQSEISQGFTSGLNSAVTALEAFNSAINALLNGPLGQAYGYGKGAAAGMHLPGSPLSNPLVGGLGGGLIGSLLGKGVGGLLGGLGKSAGGAADDAAGGASGLFSKLISGAKGLFSKGGSTADSLGNNLSKDGKAFNITDAGASAGDSAADSAASGAAGGLAGAGIGVAGSLLVKWLQEKAQSMGGFGKFLSGTSKLAGGSTGNPLTNIASNTASDISHLLHFATGGRVTEGSPKPGADDVHAMVSKDEAILNPGAAKEIGYTKIDQLNAKHANGLTTQMKDGKLHAAGGASLLSDAKKYAGHPYVYGGPSNPQQGWDCSSFASWVIGHDEGMQLPGGSWASTTNSGQIHGDTASEFLKLPGAHSEGHDAKNIQPGDVLVWPTHVGFGVGPGTMFSAYDTAEGTLQTSKDMKNASGPTGETLTIMRYGGGKNNNSTSSSTSGSSTTTTSGPASASSIYNGGGGGGGLGLSPGNYGSSDDAANVESALLGGIGGGGGFSGFSKSTTTTSTSTAAGATSNGGSTKAGKVNIGSVSSPAGWAQALLQALGDPLSSENLKSIEHWEQLEGGNWQNTAKFNPLDTTQQMSGSTNMGGGAGGAAGVQAYTSWSQGLQATLETLKNGHYSDILAQLKSGKGLTSGAAAGLSTWSGGVAAGGYTAAATGGTILAGERGPELISMENGQSASVMTAAQTQSLIKGNSAQAAQAPWVTGGMQDYSYANAPQNASRSSNNGGVNVSLNISSGAIVIQSGMGGGSSSTDISNAVGHAFSQSINTLQGNETLRNIANGVKS